MILCSGCSFTEQYHSDYPLWPYLLGYDIINIAKSGYNNIDISNSIDNYFNNKNAQSSQIQLCIVMWTQWNRENGKTTTQLNDYKLYEKQLKAVDNTNKLLSKRSIPILSFQMLRPLPTIKNNKNTIIDLVQRNRSNLFIGYPGLEELGGFNLYDKLQLDDYLRADKHPNKEGNELIADTVYKYIKYGNTCLPSTEIKS